MQSCSKSKGTHEINRTKICLFCQQKPKTALPIQGVIKTRIESLFHDYNSSDNRLPKVIFNACRQKLLYPYNATSGNKVLLPDYSFYKQVATVDDQCNRITSCDEVRERRRIAIQLR